MHDNSWLRTHRLVVEVCRDVRLLSTKRLSINLQRAAVERLRLVVLTLRFEKPLKAAHMVWNAHFRDRCHHFRTLVHVERRMRPYYTRTQC